MTEPRLLYIHSYYSTLVTFCRSTLIHQLKEAQHSLMNVIMTILQEAIPSNRAPRDFRVKYPDDVLLDQVNGQFAM